MTLIYGTCVASKCAAGYAGLLLRGPSGAGKSDLALRLMAEGWRLVADDQVVLRAINGRVWATAPQKITGLLEVRGIGLIEVEPVADVPLVGVIDLVPLEAVERLPNSDVDTLLAVDVPRFHLAPFEASAVLKVQMIARQIEQTGTEPHAQTSDK